MVGEVRLFKIDPSQQKAGAVTEVDFAEVGFRERRDIQEWIADNPSILGEDLLIIAKEFSAFDKTSDRADLVAVDRVGKVVVIELKRDDTGADVHWQAIKYASYFQNTKSDGIVRMLAELRGISEPDAVAELKSFLEVDDLELVNHDQRIILASHRFAPEVTSAVIWLNQKFPSESLISCVRLTPYHDQEIDAYFIQASTILPIAGTDEFTIGPASPRSGSGRALSAGPVRKEDETTRLLREVATTAFVGLSDESRPDKKSRWAGVDRDHRYFHVWYTQSPWSNWGMSYQIMLFPETDSTSVEVITSFKCMKDHLINREAFTLEDIRQIKSALKGLKVFPDQEIMDDNRMLELKVTVHGDTDDPKFRQLISANLRGLIEAVTPVIETLEIERNEQ